MRLWLLLACWCAFVTGAHAQTYERERTEELLGSLGLERALSPEGKRIAWVRIVRDDVFVKDEVWPLWWNWFHYTSREAIVRRELLFVEGESYREARIEESARNLRGMGAFALVRIEAVAVDDHAVGVLVHTRDLWSLRLETDFNVSTLIDYFLLNLAERNFLGRNQTLVGKIYLLPQSYKLTQQYYARRIAGSSVALDQSAGIIFNRARGESEGSEWRLKVGQPYYRLSQRWSWVAYAYYDNSVRRRLLGGELRPFSDPDSAPGAPPGRQAWRQQDLWAYLAGYLRVGERYKQTWGGGLDARRVAAHPIGESALAPELEAAFRSKILPLQRTDVGPMFSYEIMTPRYVTFENLSTYGQSENVRVGPSASLSTRVPLALLGSTRNAWVFSAQVGAVLAPGGFLLEGKVEGRTRYQSTGPVDQRLELLVRGATPVLFRAFRLVLRSTLDARRNDQAKTFVSLGASNGLRGYLSNEFAGSGASRFLTNCELRTLPIEWQAVHLGLVAFYDVGSVYRSLAAARFHHAVGLGVRFVFPQFSRYPYSLDGGNSWDPGFRFVPTIRGEQVVPLTAVEDPE